ncbi:MAG: glycosyltransferase family A protein [Paracoccaceae bacterium]
MARSRNCALTEARGRCLIFADDDIVLDQKGLDAGLAAFAADPDLVLLLGRSVDPDGNLRKSYDRQARALTRFNAAKAATFEMMIRTGGVAEARVRFDEGFGAGAPNHLGDEYIFIADLLRAGCRCVSIPVVFATHPAESSGLRWSARENLRARVAVFRRVFPRLWPLVVVAFLAKNLTRLRP